MKTSRFSDSQIIAILKQAEAGSPVPELCREHDISSATFYKWRSKFDGIDAALMARSVVEAGHASIKIACLAFRISHTCYCYEAKLNAENEVIADWLVRLTNNQRNWGYWKFSVKTIVWFCAHGQIYPHLFALSISNGKSGLKAIYQSATEENALAALDAFAQKWDAQYPAISRAWRANWAQLNPFFAYPAEIRKVIYTTNAIESLNSVLRHATKKRKIFASDDSVRKVLFLAIDAAAKNGPCLLPIGDRLWLGL